MMRTSSSVSARCVSSGTLYLSARSRHASSVARVERVRRVRRHRRRDQRVIVNSAMNASARASASAGVFASATGNLMIVSPSTARRPASFVAFGDRVLEVVHVGEGGRAGLNHLQRGEAGAPRTIAGDTVLASAGKM